MGCCYNKKIYEFSNPSEKYIRDIVSKIRVTKLKKEDLSNILDKQYRRNFKMERKFFLPLLDDCFIDDSKDNPYEKIHSAIFEMYLDSIINFACKAEILLNIFPLLNKPFTSEETDFSLLLIRYFGKEIPYKQLKFYIFRLFEFYSHRLNKAVIFTTENSQLSFSAYEMNQEFFFYDCIMKSVDYLLRGLRKNKEGENFIVKRENLHVIFIEIDTISYESIRDYIINFKLNNYELEK